MSSAINWRSGAKAGALKAAGLPGDAGQGDWDAASMPLSVGEWSVVQLQPETTGDSWKSAVSGNWTTAADWSTGVAPTSSNDATIAVAGTYTVTISSAVAAKSLTINDANATVADSSGGTLSIATTLAVTAGTFSLGSESEIIGGTISTGPSGTFSVQGGALSGVTYEGSLTLTGLGVALTLTNGTTLTGTGGTGGGALSLTGVDDSVTMTGSVSLAGSTGAGTLSLTGIIDNVDVHGTLTGVGVIDDNTEQGSLSLYDTRTLSTGTLNIGGPGYAILELVDDTGNGATLTLGSQYVVNQSGGPAAFYLINADDELINQGTITASVGNGANFQLGNMGTIVNQGSIAVSNGASMTIGAASFTNSGSLSVSGSSSVLYLDGNWVNTGSITDTGATLQLGGTFTTAALDMVADSGGGTVVIAGLLNNSGTLAVGAGSRFGTLGLAGTISGGTISDAGGGLSVSNGTLSGVTYEGSLTLATQDADLTLSGTTLTGTGGTGAGMLSITGTEDNVTLTGGTSLAGSTGAGTLSLTGIMDNVSVHGSLTGVGVIDDNTEEDSLTLFDTRTLSTGTLNIGGPGYAILELVDDTGNGATLTLGSQYVVNESVGSSAEFYLMNADDELINQGTITASVGNGVNFQLGDTGKIVNRGSIVVSNGASMTIDSTSFTNSGSVSVSGSTSVLYLQSDWVNTGSISNIGAKLELGGTFTTAALDMITDSGGGRVVIEGLLNNSGTLAVGAGSQFGALGLAGTISGGTISDAGGGLSVSNGTLSGVTYEGSLTLADFADLTLMDGTTLTGAGGSGGGVLNITGTEDVVTMTGGVSFAGSTGAGTLSVTGFRDDLIVFGSLTGLGVINDYTSEGLLIFYDTRTLSTGTLNIGGSVMFELADYTGNDATLTLGSHYVVNESGGTASFSLDADDELINQGTITASVGNGPSFQLGNTGTIVNQGSIEISNGASVTIGSTSFTNSGLLSIGGNSTVAVQPTTFTNLVGGTLTGGNFSVGSGSTIELANNLVITADDASITLSGAGSTIESLNTTTGNQATLDSKLASVGAGSTLSLLNGRNFTVVADGGSFSTTGVINLGGVIFGGTALAIGTSGSVTGYGTVQARVADSGSIIAIGGTLTMSGAVTGVGGLGAASGATVDLTAGGALTEQVFGAGTLRLDGATAYTLASSAIMTVANVLIDAGAALSGAGIVGGALIDSGTLSAIGGTLDLADGGSASGIVSGAGTLELDGATSFTLQSGATLSSAAILVDAGATLVLDSADSSIGSISGVGTLQLGSTATLAGGTDTVGALSVLAGATLSGSGTITGSLNDVGTLKASSGLLDLTGGGSISGIVNGAGTLQLDSATTTLSAATISVASLTVDAGATLSGTGTISSAIADAGTIIASGGKLTLSKAITGAGALQAAAGAVLDLTAGGALSSAISGAGTLELGGVYTLGSKLPGTSALKIDAGASLSGTGKLNGPVADFGTLDATSGTLNLIGAVTGNGTLSAASGAVIAMAQGGDFGGALTGAGTLKILGAATFSSSASLSVANVNDLGNITLGAGASLANGVGDDFAIGATAGQILHLKGGAGASFTNAGSFTLNAGGTADVSVGFINSGTASVGSGTLAFIGAVSNTGTIDAAAGTVSFKKALGGAGTLDIGSGATVSLLAGAVAGQSVDFLAGTGLLDLTKPTSFAGTISGFGGSDQIDLIKTAETGFSYAGNTLTVMDGKKVVASLNFAGSYTTSSFALGTDGHGGTFISVA